MIDLEAIRRRCEAATLPPWKFRKMGDMVLVSEQGCRPIVLASGRSGLLASDRSDNMGGIMRLAKPGDPDPDFIAHARTDLPAVLDLVEEKDRRIEELEGALRQAFNACANGDCGWIISAEAYDMMRAALNGGGDD